MRLLRWSLPVLLCFLCAVPGATAGEGGDAATVADRALEALKLRLEARMKEGELLAQSGRLEEALEAYRSVGELYERGMADVRQLLADLPATATRDPEQPAPEVGDAFAGRRGAREAREKASAGTRDPNRVVDDALRWLAAHQAPNGGWEAAGFRRWCDGKPQPEARQPDGVGKVLYDPGVTGLATLAFLGAGYTNRGKHPFAATVSRALRYLKNSQDPEGCFGPRTTQQYIYNHGYAALAMIEAYGMTGSPIFKGSAQRALDFIFLARNPYFAWRYGIKPGDNDTSVTTLMTMCVKSAELINKSAEQRGKPAPLAIDKTAYDGVRAWLDKVTDPDYGRVGYVQRGTGVARPQELVDRFPSDKSEAMTAAGILCRILIGEDPQKSELVQKGADLVAKLPPSWDVTDGSIDMIYWYYGSLAMYQVGGKPWEVWRDAMPRAILATQRQDGNHCGVKGSWDPVGPWGLDGGRVYSTALMCLTTSVYMRHSKVFGAK